MWSGFFVTVVTPVLSNQRAAVLRQGGHVLGRRFRYYVPDFSGRTVVQTPLIVRWVSLFFLPALSVIWVSLYSCRCLLLLYLMVVWFWASFWWVLFSSDRDDSFIKLHEAFSVLFAARLRILHMLVCLSWNGNYNGFDLIGLNFLYAVFRSVGVWCFLTTVAFFALFSRSSVRWNICILSAI